MLKAKDESFKARLLRFNCNSLAVMHANCPQATVQLFDCRQAPGSARDRLKAHTTAALRTRSAYALQQANEQRSACMYLLQGKRVAVSGAGNVATYAAEKLLELGAIVITMSDSTGYVYEPEGFTKEV